MSLTVVFRETALRALARLRSEDRDAFCRARRAIADLADQPRPDAAVPWGGTGICRLHSGEIRVLYEIDSDTSTVFIINVGRA